MGPRTRVTHFVFVPLAAPHDKVVASRVNESLEDLGEVLAYGLPLGWPPKKLVCTRWVHDTEEADIPVGVFVGVRRFPLFSVVRGLDVEIPLFGDLGEVVFKRVLL